MGATQSLLRPLLAGMLVLLLLAGCRTTGDLEERQRLAELEEFYQYWKGTEYQYGGSSQGGVDCSALVAAAYQDVFSVNLPRTTETQSKRGKRVRRGSLEAGDLVFFKTGWRTRHVGIYLDDGLFMHSSESSGVIKSSLNSDYWRKHYWKSRRILH